MSKTDKKLICVLLTFIIVLSIIFIYKILSSREYDKNLYAQIYMEYNEIFENEVEQNKNSISFSNTISDNKKEEKNDTIYVSENVSNEGNVNNKYSNSDNVIAQIIIPELGINYPVISETNDEYLKIAPCRLRGGEPNTVGNLSIIGHNYKNSQFFSKIHTLEKGDMVILRSRNNTILEYKVYDMYKVKNNDFSCTNTSTNGTIELTLITCTNSKSTRYVVKCIAEKWKTRD